jgi:hypothetical protein
LELPFLIGIDKELTISKLETKVNRIDLDTAILGLRSSLVSISEPDKSFNLDLFLTINPLDDAQKGADDISMNREEKVSVCFIESTVIKKVGPTEILPPGGLELLVNEGVYVVDCELLRGLHYQVLTVGERNKKTQDQDDGDN